MTRPNDDRILLVTLTEQERQALLEHSVEIDAEIQALLISSVSGKMMMTGEQFNRFMIQLAVESEFVADHAVQAMFDKICKRLSNQFFDAPETPPWTEQMENEVLNKIDSIDPEELHSLLDSITASHNTSPDPELGDLSPTQVRLLLNTDWDAPEFPIKFNVNLSIEQLKSSDMFNNTRLFLNRLVEFKDKDSATAKGYLNRTFVRSVFDDMVFPKGFREQTLAMNKVLNELDVYPLHIIKCICDCAGLVKKRGKKFYVVKKHLHLLDDKNASLLYQHLFNGCFRKFDLAYMSPSPELNEIQDTIEFSFYRLSQVCGQYRDLDFLTENILLPYTKEIMYQQLSEYRNPAYLVYARIIKPLLDFGLLETKTKVNTLEDNMKIRKTDLFDSFLTFEL